MGSCLYREMGIENQDWSRQRKQIFIQQLAIIKERRQKLQQLNEDRLQASKLNKQIRREELEREIEILRQREILVGEIKETGLTFEEQQRLKQELDLNQDKQFEMNESEIIRQTDDMGDESRDYDQKNNINDSNNNLNNNLNDSNDTKHLQQISAAASIKTQQQIQEEEKLKMLKEVKNLFNVRKSSIVENYKRQSMVNKFENPIFQPIQEGDDDDDENNDQYSQVFSEND